MKFLKSLLLMILILTFNIYAQETTPAKTTLYLQGKHRFEFAGFYAAKEKGFYKKGGLDVSFVEFEKNKNITEKVLSGKAQYGLGDASIVADYLKGKSLVLLANFFKQSPLVLIAQENIKTPAELSNKKIMGLSNSIHDITLLTMLNKFNIGLDNITTVPASFNTDAFIDKKVDAMSVFTTNELYSLNQKDVKYNIFDPVIYGAKHYTANLFTSAKELHEHPEQVARFTKASIEGWEYALGHKKEIVELILKKYNTQHKSKAALLFEAKQIEQLMLPSMHKIGSIDIYRIEEIAESFIQAGFVDTPVNRDISHFIYHYDSQSKKRVWKKKTAENSMIDEVVLLTAEEKKYLSSKKVVTMCIDPDWMPYESIKQEKHIGISADYLKKISLLIHIPFTLIHTKSWSESLAMFKDKQCDILSLVAQTPKRLKEMSFTKPYLSSPLVLATTYDKSFISDISKLKEKKVGLVRSYASSELLKNKYLDIHFIEVDTLSEGLKKLENSELYAMIDTLTTLSYQIQNYFPKQLKISGQLQDQLHLGIAVQKTEPELLSILNKAINTIKTDSNQYILNQWVKVRFEKGDRSVEAFLKIILPVLLLFGLLIISHFIQRQYSKRLKKQVNLNIEALREKDEVLIQKQRMADMGEMLSMIAHQWRQPLGAINSTISGVHIKIASGQYNLDHPADQEDFLNYLERKLSNITQYVQHLSTTTDDFRNFFNPNKNKELTSLVLPIESALNIVENSLQKSGIKIIKDLQENPTFNMYPNEIVQVILNLLKNSEYNFLDKKIKDPKIIIVTYTRKNKTVISVCDNGGGIPANIAKKIFTPYFSTKTERNGTGLGLYMSKIIIEDHHNGSLAMKNRHDGVCFEMIFKI